jgi:hypothetical protein
VEDAPELFKSSEFWHLEGVITNNYLLFFLCFGIPRTVEDVTELFKSSDFTHLEGVISLSNNYLLLCLGIAGNSGFALRVIVTGATCTSSICCSTTIGAIEVAAGMDILENKL